MAVTATGRARSPRTAATARVALGLAVAAVLVQVTYPLLAGAALRGATVASVVLFCAAALGHAAATRGARAAVTVLAVCGGTGLAAEAVGVATGVPFGQYAYTGSLGVQVLGVPLLVPLAWTMMAWPALVAARTLVPGWAAVPVAAWALAAWDLYLDPQMVAAGHWTWAFPEPGLPGVEGIPLTNFAGWLAVALLMQAALAAAVPRREPAGHAVPAVLLGWTWLGSAVANAAFFGRPEVAAWGSVAMGAVVGPYLLRLARRRAAPAPPARSGS